MVLSSFHIVIGLTGIFFLIGVYFTLRTHRKEAEKRDLRRYLAEKMNRTPLPKMLQALGIGGTQFLRSSNIDQMSQAIDNCEKCEDIDQCQDKLKIPELNPEDIEFCDNKKYLAGSSRSQRIKQ